MTYKFICEILERNGESAILLEDCVLNTTTDRGVVYTLWGDTDYEQRELEICYADNHSDIIWKGMVKNKQQLEKIVSSKLK